MQEELKRSKWKIRSEEAQFYRLKIPSLIKEREAGPFQLLLINFSCNVLMRTTSDRPVTPSISYRRYLFLLCFFDSFLRRLLIVDVPLTVAAATSLSRQVSPTPNPQQPCLVLAISISVWTCGLWWWCSFYFYFFLSFLISISSKYQLLASLISF